jgi:nucleotide-binding universal stress UspA family protein
MVSNRTKVSNISAAHKLLLPIDATKESHWGLRYAIDRAKTGERIEACLLFLAERVRDWQVLKFKTEEEVHGHFRDRSKLYLGEAAAILREAGVPSSEYFREADEIFGILDFAEEHNCTEIVVPRLEWLGGLFAYGISARLKAAERAIPVVFVGADGLAVGRERR